MLKRARSVVTTCALLVAAGVTATSVQASANFKFEEATIAEVQSAILSGKLTATDLVKMSLTRIKAYNGACVKEPQGLLGSVVTIPNAHQVNALGTLNLRPAARKAWGFDDRKARSMTDAVDSNPDLPDALESAAKLDAAFKKTGKLVGPLHGVIMSIKDQYDTIDMRTTSGADAPYANDRPPNDSTFAAKLRAAGAIIIGKANMGEYAAGYRSAFGGTFCNPYDTERSPGGSSGGSGSSVATSMVICSIGEESGPSIRSPAKNNNAVGLSPTQELVSRFGMIPASFMNDRVGPICRTVADSAKILDVIAGYDPKDELTVFSLGRAPTTSYASVATTNKAMQPLKGVRIGVVREYMDKKLFTAADAESIDIINREVAVLSKLGATLVDPGEGGALFQSCLAKYDPHVHNSAFTKQFPQLFPYDGNGNAATDHAKLLANMYSDSSKFPTGKNAPSIRDLGPMPTSGERKYMMERYLQQRGDANIKSVQDLIDKSVFYESTGENSGFQDKKKTLETANKEWKLDVANRLQTRWALQQIALQCMTEMNLDALTYPTGNIPAPKIGAPSEPTINGRQSNAWTLLGQNGFPAITVPAGFTTVVYDRIADAKSPSGTKLVGPVRAKLPVGIDFLARPFAEQTLIKIASAYESATHHRTAPVGFETVKSE